MQKNISFIETISSDLNMSSYKGEAIEEYCGRVIYSAMSLWLKAITLDTNNSDEEEHSKSKHYVFKRGTVILEELLAIVPECYDWYWKNYYLSKKEENHPIRIIRERMLCSGELIEIGFQTEIGVIKEKWVPICDEYQRYIGLEPHKCLNLIPAGITCLNKNTKNKNFEENQLKFGSLDFLKWLCSRSKWKEYSDTIDFEFFQPLKKDAPYRSWSDRLPSQNSENIFLGRIRLDHDIKEYYLFKREGARLFLSKIDSFLCEEKEERRVVLALRKIAGNSMKAIVFSKEKVIVLKLFCRLPLREERLFQTFCWPKNDINDFLNYIIPIELWVYIKSLLIELGIDVEERV